MQMSIEEIKQLETANDGQTIHLFYDEMIGLYLAYGLSAYYTTMVLTPNLSFSNALMMPVALLSRNNVLYLRQSVTKLEHKPKSYYRFLLRSKVGTAGYKRWCKETFGDAMSASQGGSQ